MHSIIGLFPLSVLDITSKNNCIMFYWAYVEVLEPGTGFADVNVVCF